MEGFAPVDLEGKAVLFDGTTRHRNEEAKGDRYSIVAFTNSAWPACTESQCAELRRLGFPAPGRWAVARRLVRAGRLRRKPCCGCK